jgi:hypothetical protein
MPSLNDVREAWPGSAAQKMVGPNSWVREVGDTAVIVDSGKGGRLADLYEVPWSADGDKVTFGTPTKVAPKYGDPLSASASGGSPRRYADEDPVDYAVRSGRLHLSSAPMWRARLAEERRTVRASGGSGRSQVEADLAALYPIPVGVAASAPGVPSPAPGQYDALFPAGTVEEQRQRWAVEDEQADREQARRDAERDQVAASAAALTEREYQQIFGPD